MEAKAYLCVIGILHSLDQSLTTFYSINHFTYQATKFELFWTECRKILIPTSSAEERRHSDIAYASEVISIPSLIRRATENLQKQVEDGTLTELPPIPSTEWVRLQFAANNDTVEKAAHFAGVLGVKRAIQKRTLSKEHEDQHWVNAMTRYHLEWIIELRLLTKLVEFFGQDDKAKIPVGDRVAVSTGVRRSATSIVPVEGGQEMLRAMDHDFGYGNLTPSVTLRCNIPNDMSGSFFSGGVDGFGQIFVTLRDSIFDGSTVFDHCAQLCDTLERRNLNPTVLMTQYDGGVDHSLVRAETKMALIGTFKDRDLDSLVALRGAPNGSARNKCERAMSPLNPPISNVATRRGTMPEWAETALRNCSSMADVRKLCAMFDKIREQAIQRLRVLDETAAKRDIIHVIHVMVNNQVSLQEDYPTATTHVVILVCNFLDIEYDTYSNETGAVSAIIEADDGSIDYTRRYDLLNSVSSAQRSKAQVLASHDFQKEWASAIKLPIDFLAERLGQVSWQNF